VPDTFDPDAVQQHATAETPSIAAARAIAGPGSGILPP
jgi:hypothetical protein